MMKRLGIVVFVLGPAWIAGCGGSHEGAQASEDELVSTSCSSLSVEGLRPGARDFFLAEGLGKASDESEIVPDLIRSRWTALEIVEPRVEHAESTCLVVMNLATVVSAQDGTTTTEPSYSYDVIAVEKTTKAFSRFETAIAVPDRLQAAYGPAHARMQDGSWTPETTFYYVELTGTHVLDTWKAVAAGMECSGFAAEISAKNVKRENYSLSGEPDGKVDFDPTPNRTWKLKNASYSLRRGLTAEVLDVYADQLDLDFELYFSGSGGEVAPWGSPVRRWKRPTDAAWNDIPRPPPPF